MRLLVGGKALLLALASALVVSYTPSIAVQSMSRTWFRSKLSQFKNVASLLRPPRHVPLTDIAKLASLENFIARLHSAGYRRPRSEEELLGLFDVLKTCFREFGPPPGLALDFTPDPSLAAQEKVRRMFMFFQPEKLIFDPTHAETKRTSFVQMHEGEATALDAEPAKEPDPAEAEHTQVSPLRPVRFAADAKQILATIIKAVHNHFNGPSCQTAVKRLDGIKRFFLRSSSVGSVMEPLLVYALIQGNAASAARFAHHVAHASSAATSGDLMQHVGTSTVPSNISNNPGVYDPLLIVAYFDLAKASGTSQMKKLEKRLQRSADEMVLAGKLFGNALANPDTHEKVTRVGSVVGSDESLLQTLIERIGKMAIDSSEAVSILLPKFPRVAALVRGVTLFAFEGVFKQQGHYVIPGLPCGGNLTGSMEETGTGRKLGVTYYVYKYTRPVFETPPLPDIVWNPDGESEVAVFFKQHNQEKGEYLLAHTPRVCVRSASFDKCSKAPPKAVTTADDLLCQFIFDHRSLFFQVNGKGVYGLRKNMQKTLPAGGKLARARALLGRSWRAIRRFLLSKTSLALVLGGSIGGICIAAGLAGVLSGSLCAVGALGAGALFSTLFGVAAFGAKPGLPLSLGELLAADFERNLDMTEYLLKPPPFKSTPAPDTEYESARDTLPVQ